MSIIAQDLTKMYGLQTAVNAVSFSINAGEIVGFLGPNGAGKSTTMKMLTGFLPPTKGNGLICGLPIIGNSIEVRKKIGYLPEHNPLYLDMYVKEFLNFAAEVTGLKKYNSRVKEVIELTGLGLEQRKQIGQLSKGYRQRVGLAQAIMHNPDVLILDEPTGGLDPNQVVEIRELIKNLGKTTLLSSHIMQEVEAVCSRVIIIDKGNLVADSTIENVASLLKAKVIVYIAFALPIEIKKLETLIGLESIEKTSELAYKLTLKSEEIKNNLSQFCLQNQWQIVDFRTETISLEKVFQQMTNANK